MLNEPADLKPGLVFTGLDHFGLVRISGEDARTFLHNQLSCDVAALQPGQAQYGSYNTPKGRMLATFLLWRDGADYFMQLPRSLCDSIRKRLTVYVLRAKVSITDAGNEYALLGLAGAHAEVALNPWFTTLPQAPLNLTAVQDLRVMRLSEHRFEIIVPAKRAPEIEDTLDKSATRVVATAWDRLDILDGIPYISPSTQDQFVPQMANLDLIGGVSFSKGCYPGQEIVARMHYLGRLKQRMYLAHIAADSAPQPADKLFSADFGEQACGMVVNCAPSPDGGFDVLAVMQIASAVSGAVHWNSLDGATLNFLELPYRI